MTARSFLGYSVLGYPIMGGWLPWLAWRTFDCDRHGDLPEDPRQICNFECDRLGVEWMMWGVTFLADPVRPKVTA